MASPAHAFGFTGRNTQAQRVAARSAARFITSIARSTVAAIRSMIVRSIAEGVPVYDAARAIRAMIGLNEQQAAAAESYRRELIDSGLALERVDRELERYTARQIRRRAETIARTECLPAETLVDDAVVWAAHRRPYQGALAKVRTDGGREFAATPNHPMLTARGWVPAGDLQAGDYLICNRIGNKEARPTRDEHVAHRPSAIGQVFDAVSAVGVLERRDCREPDFHGDGRNGEVDVASTSRVLSFGAFAPLYESMLEGVLSPADLARAPLCPTCRRLLEINEAPCFCNASLGDATFLQSEEDDALRHTERLSNSAGGLPVEVSADDRRSLDVAAIGGASTALGEEGMAGLSEGPHHASSSDGTLDQIDRRTYPLSDDTEAQAGTIERDRILSVATVEYSGHVFNLSTTHGYFTINGGIYTGNTMSALNEGQREAWREAKAEGLLSDEAVVEWITTPDERLCPVCAPLDGVKVPFGEKFATANGELPGPPAHPNCRCATAVTDPLP